MKRYCITDSLDVAARAAFDGVDMIQIRAKKLSGRRLSELVRAVVGLGAKILVTHDLDECFELGDEIIVLREGRMVQSGPPRAVFEQPANVDVARLLGLYNLLPVEIRGLDPGRNMSRLRYQDFELSGPYFPGRLIGDRVWLCIRPDLLSVAPRNGRPGTNQMPATLLRVVEKPGRQRMVD